MGIRIRELLLCRRYQSTPILILLCLTENWARQSDTDASRSEGKDMDHPSEALVNVTQKCPVLLGTEVLWRPLLHGFTHPLGTKAVLENWSLGI